MIDEGSRKREDAVLLSAEYDAMKEAGFIVTDLKATVEKIVIIIGLSFGKDNLDSLQKHKQKLAALEMVIPEETKSYWYYEFVYNAISSHSLETLNSLRNGLVYKKGISDLQPHIYLSGKAKDSPMFKFFDKLMELHAKNTALFLGALAF